MVLPRLSLEYEDIDTVKSANNDNFLPPRSDRYSQIIATLSSAKHTKTDSSRYLGTEKWWLRYGQRMLGMFPMFTT